jgi:predicted P-loop ATPase
MALTPNADWFSDSLGLHHMGDHGTGSMAISGKWIVELSELSGGSKSEQETVKGFLTRPSDHYRKPYARYFVDRRRECIFIGTSNEHHPLADPTGATRWLPVNLSGVDVEGIARDRDRLWAEAVHRVKSGEPWAVDSALYGECQHHQSFATRHDSWEETIDGYISSVAFPFTVADVAIHALFIPIGKITRSDETRIGAILRVLGYFSHQKTDKISGKIMRFYQKR